MVVVSRIIRGAARGLIDGSKVPTGKKLENTRYMARRSIRTATEDLRLIMLGSDEELASYAKLMIEGLLEVGEQPEPVSDGESEMW